MLSILDRYIIKKFLGTYLFSIVLIISIAVVFDFNEQLDKFIKNNASKNEIIYDYYLNFVPYYINLFTPLFVFISVIFFTSKLADNSEIIAMQAAGMSFKRLIKPYMVAAAAIAITSFILSSYVIPPANVVRIKFQNKYISKNKVKTNEKHIQLQIEPDVVAYISVYNVNDKSGNNFSLDKFENKQLSSRLTAPNIKYDSLNHWKIYDYSIRKFEGTKEIITTGNRLDTILNFKPSDFLIQSNDYEQMTNQQLRKYIKQQKERGIGNIQSFEIEYHKRFASLASAFILTIIGASLSSRKIKGGMGMNIGIGILLSMSYILFSKISSSFAVSGLVSPFISAWIPNVLFSLIAVRLYTKAPN